MKSKLWQDLNGELGWKIARGMWSFFGGLCLLIAFALFTQQRVNSEINYWPDIIALTGAGIVVLIFSLNARTRVKLVSWRELLITRKDHTFRKPLNVMGAFNGPTRQNKHVQVFGKWLFWLFKISFMLIIGCVVFLLFIYLAAALMTSSIIACLITVIAISSLAR